MKNTIKALGWRTDLLLLGTEAEIEEKSDYVVGRCPEVPEFYWGNFLVFRQPPKQGDLERWISIFQQEFAGMPAVRHVTLGWDDSVGDKGEIKSFVDAGFGFEKVDVQVATEESLHNKPKGYNKELEVRPINKDEEWRSSMELQISSHGPNDPSGLAAFSTYCEKMMSLRQALVRAGRGLWWGAWCPKTKELVGNLGVFWGDTDLARYNEVLTAEKWRRRGVCTTLMARSAHDALSRPKIKRLVITADIDSAASKIYEALGFIKVEREVGLLRRPKSKTK